MQRVGIWLPLDTCTLLSSLIARTRIPYTQIPCSGDVGRSGTSR